MRIIDQARLWFQEGRSDKVYEVDLVEVAKDQYAVNFRFGRRGTALRDGTKTPLPVSLEQARTLFSRLVEEKTGRGYRPLDAPGDARPSRGRTREHDEATRQARTKQALVQALGRGYRSEIPLHLVVRQVRDLGLREAEPLLLELLAAGPPKGWPKPDAFRHGLVAALARCGSDRAVAPLERILQEREAPRHLRNVTLLALTMVGGSEQRSRIRETVTMALLPTQASELAAQVRAAEEMLTEKPGQAHAAVLALYASGPAKSSVAEPGTHAELDQRARNIVLAVARMARLTGEELGLLRALNWAAELRRDGELFALLTRRFESRPPGTQDTLNYFRRRAARTLRRIGSLGSPDYVTMASELLLRYRDGDAEPVRNSSAGSWDAFGRYHALNFVLYGNSRRYERAGHRRATWRCRKGYAPGEPAPKEREESFPSLWNQDPSALWRLGISDAASIVLDFALRALRQQPDYLAALPDAELAHALARAQRPMRLFAFEVARKRPANLILARAALDSELEEANDWVLDWVRSSPGLLGERASLLALLITAKSRRVRETAASVTNELTIAGDLARELVFASIAILMAFVESPADEERAESAGNYLLERAPEGLLGLAPVVLRDLLGHPLSGVARLGAQLALLHSNRGDLEPGLLDELLGSKHAVVRTVGARIVANTPPEVMKNEPDLLVHFALSDSVELRAGTRHLIASVARLYPDVGRDIAARLVDALLTRQPTGAPAHVVSMLRHELQPYLAPRSTTQVMALIGALSPHAREAGGLLLALLGPDDLDLDSIVRLANHEILSIRQGAWSLAGGAKDRFRLAPVALARLCNARWDDSRTFAFEFVRSFPAEELVPDTVIAICDSIDPVVQRFGQTLLLEYWRDEDAERYLLRLSEHPSPNIQLTVTGLLDRYARGKPALLERLLPYLTTVLSQVNRGAVAKQRVLEFIRREAVSSLEAATMLAPLLDRQSLTRASSHRSPLIATMVDLHEKYPDVRVPIAIYPAPLRSRSRRGV